MKNYTIPKGEQHNVMSSFWCLLMEYQRVAYNTLDPVLMRDCEKFFDQWNKLTGENQAPMWRYNHG